MRQDISLIFKFYENIQILKVTMTITNVKIQKFSDGGDNANSQVKK